MRRIKSNLGPFESVGCADKLGVVMERIWWAKMRKIEVDGCGGGEIIQFSGGPHYLFIILLKILTCLKLLSQ